MKKQLFILLLISLFLTPGIRGKEIFRFEIPQKDNPAQSNFNKGKMALDEKLYSSAIQYFTEYLKLIGTSEPRFAEGSLLLAKSHLKNGAPLKALGVLDAHQKHSPGLQDVSLRATLTYTRAQALAMSEQWTPAIEELSSLRSLPCSLTLHKDAILLTADCMMKLAQWDKILSLLKGFVTEHPEFQKDFQIQYRMAEAYIAIQGYTDAKKLLNEMNPAPENELQYKLLSIRNLALLHQPDEALQLYQSIANRLPDSPDIQWWSAQTALADALLLAKRYPEAITFYTHSLKMAPSNQELKQAYAYLVNTYLAIENLPKAQETLSIIEQQFPGSPELLNLTASYATTLKNASNFTLAAETYQKLSAYPHATPKIRYKAHCDRGDCLYRLGKYTEAITAFGTAETQGESPSEKAYAKYRMAQIAQELYETSPTDHLSSAQFALAQFASIADQFSSIDIAVESRFNQGLLHKQLQNYPQAVQVFAQFVQQFPQNAKVPEAQLLQGICLRLGATTLQAKIQANLFLDSLGKKQKNTIIGEQAFLEAFKAASEATQPQLAEQELTQIIEAPKSTLKNQALYLRALTRFNTSHIAQAREDAQDFFNEFPQDSLANQLYLLLGDSYANEDKLDEALKYYTSILQKDTPTPNLLLASTVYYEIANTYYKQGNYPLVISNINTLQTLLQSSKQEFSQELKLRLAKGIYLKGDALAFLNNFNEAEQAYNDCQLLCPNTQLALSALGRQGEMLLEKAISSGSLKNDTEAQANFEKATRCFETIRTQTNSQNPLHYMAAYHLAYTLKHQKRLDEALEKYQHLFFAFKDKAQTTPLDDFYFAKTTFDMAEILESKGDAESLIEAKRHYLDLAHKNLPTSPTARERAAAIEKKLRQ